MLLLLFSYDLTRGGAKGFSVEDWNGLLCVLFVFLSMHVNARAGGYQCSVALLYPFFSNLEFFVTARATECTHSGRGSAFLITTFMVSLFSCVFV